jgi:hypothetical protein
VLEAGRLATGFRVWSTERREIVLFQIYHGVARHAIINPNIESEREDGSVNVLFFVGRHHGREDADAVGGLEVGLTQRSAENPVIESAFIQAPDLIRVRSVGPTSCSRADGLTFES